MPRPIDADWQLIKALFLQGFTQRQIAQRTGVSPGTIKGRATRHGWSLLRNSANATLVHPGLAALTQHQSKSLLKASQQAQDTFSTELAIQSQVLAANPPRKLVDLANTPRREGRASVVQKLVNTASKLYGWDSQTNSPQAMNLTQINVTPAGDRSPGAKVIDVPYEP
jgi:transcriptional regulator with XRE-family HTH domain